MSSLNPEELKHNKEPCLFV